MAFNASSFDASRMFPAQGGNGTALINSAVNQQQAFTDKANSTANTNYQQELANWKMNQGRGGPETPMPTAPTQQTFNPNQYATNYVNYNDFVRQNMGNNNPTEVSQDYFSTPNASPQNFLVNRAQPQIPRVSDGGPRLDPTQAISDLRRNVQGAMPGHNRVPGYNAPQMGGGGNPQQAFMQMMLGGMFNGSQGVPRQQRGIGGGSLMGYPSEFGSQQAYDQSRMNQFAGAGGFGGGGGMLPPQLMQMLMGGQQGGFGGGGQRGYQVDLPQQGGMSQFAGAGGFFGGGGDGSGQMSATVLPPEGGFEAPMPFQQRMQMAQQQNGFGGGGMGQFAGAGGFFGGGAAPQQNPQLDMLRQLLQGSNQRGNMQGPPRTSFASPRMQQHMQQRPNF